MFSRNSFFILLLLPVISFSSPKISPDSMSALVWAYSLATIPNLNPNFQLTITEYDVKDLYDSLGVQVFKADFLSQDGTWFRSGEYIYRNGTVTPFASDFGGWGLMSGVVVNRTFYYTYSWGSGIHRSHIGCFFLDGDTLKFLDTGGFINVDLFISNCSGDSICVYTGAYKSFNSWMLVKDNKWRVVIVNGTSLAVIDSTGKEVAPNIPLATWGGMKVRQSNVHGRFSSIPSNPMVNIRGQIVCNPVARSIVINKKRSLVIISPKTQLVK